MRPQDRLIVALDVDSEEKALNLVGKLNGVVNIFKVGSELFTACGPCIVEKINKSGSKVFLDLKFHDIPNTVAKAARAATRLKTFMFNVHAIGGIKMMRMASESVKVEAKDLNIERPKVLAVTMLTSLDKNDLKKIGVDDNIKAQILRLAKMAKDAGLDGVVASANEAKSIRKKMGEDFLIITPGVRPSGEARHDQKRIATPTEAVSSGADYIVVGRPIIEAKDPREAAKQILKEIEQ